HRREGRPGKRITLAEGLDPVAHRAAVVVQVEQDAVVLRGRRILRCRPLAGDVGAERVESLDHAEVTVSLELEAGGESQVAAAALARHYDPGPGRCSGGRRSPLPPRAPRPPPCAPPPTRLPPP